MAHENFTFYTNKVNEWLKKNIILKLYIKKKKIRINFQWIISISIILNSILLSHHEKHK